MIQILLTCVAMIAMIGLWRRFAHGAAGRGEFAIWAIIWISAIVFVWNPSVTNKIAGFLGVGRGADALLYISVVVLFYSMLRLYGKMENIEHSISDLVKKIALQDFQSEKIQDVENKKQDEITDAPPVDKS